MMLASDTVVASGLSIFDHNGQPSYPSCADLFNFAVYAADDDSRARIGPVLLGFGRKVLAKISLSTLGVRAART